MVRLHLVVKIRNVFSKFPHFLHLIISHEMDVLKCLNRTHFNSIESAFISCQYCKNLI